MNTNPDVIHCQTISEFVEMLLTQQGDTLRGSLVKQIHKAGWSDAQANLALEHMHHAGKIELIYCTRSCQLKVAKIGGAK